MNNNRTIFSLIITALLLTNTTPMNANPLTDWWNNRKIAQKRANILTRDAKLEEKDKVIADKLARQEARIKTHHEKIFKVAQQAYGDIKRNINGFSDWACNKLDISNLGKVVTEIPLDKNKEQIRQALTLVQEVLTEQLDQYQAALAVQGDQTISTTSNYSRSASSVGSASDYGSTNSELAALMRQNAGTFEFEDRVTPWLQAAPNFTLVTDKSTQAPDRQNRFQQTAQQVQKVNAFRTRSTTPTTTEQDRLYSGTILRPHRYVEKPNQPQWGSTARNLTPALRYTTPAEKAVWEYRNRTPEQKASDSRLTTPSGSALSGSRRSSRDSSN